MNRDEYFMDLALKEAKKAYDKGEVPILSLIHIQMCIRDRGWTDRWCISYHANGNAEQLSLEGISAEGI